MYSDRELLELAARAAGLQLCGYSWVCENEDDEECEILESAFVKNHQEQELSTKWNPLADDGDAMRLAAKLNLDVTYDSCCCGVEVSVGGKWDNAPASSVGTYERIGLPVIRMCIVRAAAAIGEGMQ